MAGAGDVCGQIRSNPVKSGQMPSMTDNYGHEFSGRDGYRSDIIHVIGSDQARRQLGASGCDIQAWD